MKANDIVALIAKSIPDAEVHIEDARGDGEHYLAKITSTAFKGKSRVQQHQMVFAALGKKMGSELHAFSFRTIVKED